MSYWKTNLQNDDSDIFFLKQDLISETKKSEFSC